LGCTDRELFWIKELGTAMPYGCNDNIKGVGNLSSPGFNEINVMSLFNTIPRTKRSLIFEIWWNFFYDLYSIKNVADVNSIDSFVSKRNIEEFYVVIMQRFRSNWFKKTKGRHVTYNTRQSVLRRKRIMTAV
jgi:hypothetical protein